MEVTITINEEEIVNRLSQSITRKLEKEVRERVIASIDEYINKRIEYYSKQYNLTSSVISEVDRWFSHNIYRSVDRTLSNGITNPTLEKIVNESLEKISQEDIDNQIIEIIGKRVSDLYRISPERRNKLAEAIISISQKEGVENGREE